MRRVVVTGLGIVSSIGNGKDEVLRSLRANTSGLGFVPQMEALGYRCQVAGRVRGLDAERIGKRPLRTMSDVARFAGVAALEALDDAGLDADALRAMERDRVGIVVGTGAGGVGVAARAGAWLLEGGHPARLGAIGVVKVMNSTAALNLAAWLGIRGRCYSVSSACATSTDDIGHAFELIRHGQLDLCICGGAEENGVESFWAFSDSLQACPTGFNDRPESACRPFDRDRQGMVLSEGAGVLVLEAQEPAQRRGATIHAELLAYASANDGGNMFEPSGRGLKKCLEQALAAADRPRIDYINPHGPGTKVGDPLEVRVIHELFGDSSPLVSSTKGLTGHAVGAAGAHEMIYSLLMLQHGFVAPTANLEHVDDECDGIRHVQSRIETPWETGLSYNAGLGGSNACLIFRKP